MPSLKPPVSHSFYFYCGVFGLCFSTLMLEIVQTRILSVISWYYLAFFVIGLAMFGMTAGAVWVFLNQERFLPERYYRDLSHATTAFACSTVVGLIFQFTLSPQDNHSFTVYGYWLALALSVGAPFFFSGIAVSLAVTRSPFPVGKVYAVDLTGAALGCFGVYALLLITDAYSAVFWIAATAAFSAFSFSCADRQNTQQPLRILPLCTMAIFILFGILNGLTYHGLQPLYIKGQLNERDGTLKMEDWNLFSRVALYHYPERTLPLLWGPSPNLPQHYTVDQRHMSIDGAAGTFMIRFDGDPQTVDFLKYDLTNLAYHIRNSGSCAVIGVGGGRDVLSAWIFGFRQITGIELNPIFVDWLCHHPFYAEYANLCQQEGIHVIADEARSWFARHESSFDLIQLSMIDTWASTSAGAFTLSENGLYTVEAFQTFLSKLTPQGILTVSRWYAPGEINETGRLVSLATAALLELGIQQPHRHLYLAQVNNTVATLLINRSPFSAPDLQKLDEITQAYAFTPVLHPNHIPTTGVLASIVNSRYRSDLLSVTSSYALDLTPPTDNRPFFFNQLPLSNPFKIARLSLSAEPQGGVISGNLKATGALITAILVFVILVTTVILLPLQASIRRTGGVLTVYGSLYFALLGFAFMMVEIGLIQRISLFLGHPTYSLCVVLFCIILSTGIGSYCAGLLPFNRKWKPLLWSLVLGGSLLYMPPFLSETFTRFETLHMSGRILLSILILLPTGFLMGFGFPNGIRLVEDIDPTPTPWFWGINGAMGVLATGLATAVSIAFGLHVTLWVGAVAYLLIAIPAVKILHHSKTNSLDAITDISSTSTTDNVL